MNISLYIPHSSIQFPVQMYKYFEKKIDIKISKNSGHRGYVYANKLHSARECFQVLVTGHHIKIILHH